MIEILNLNIITPGIYIDIKENKIYVDVARRRKSYYKARDFYIPFIYDKKTVQVL